MGPNELLKSFYLLRMADGDDPMEPRILMTIVDALAERVSYEAGAVIFNEGEAAEAMYVVEKGTVEIARRDASPHDGDTAIARLGTGKEFGEMAFFDGGPRSATARAGTQCSVFRVGYADLRREMQRRPATAALLYRNAAAFLAQRLRETSGELALSVERARRP
jgi:CRP/FNR family transcriptional regulator, cyclic AMP receptor protein